MVSLEETFEKFKDEYLKTHFVREKLNARTDLHAFLLLDRLVPGSIIDMIAAAEQGEIFLSVDTAALAKAAMEEDVLTLVRCGVRYDPEKGLFMCV